MGMSARLLRIKSNDFDLLEAGESLLESPLEIIDVDKSWESILYVFGNGFVGAPITGSIFMPSNSTGDDEFGYDEDSIRYHSDSDIHAINKLIGDLDEPEIRKIIQPEKMNNVYRFNPDSTEKLVENCIQIVSMFANAEKNGDVVIVEMG